MGAGEDQTQPIVLDRAVLPGGERAPLAREQIALDQDLQHFGGASDPPLLAQTVDRLASRRHPEPRHRAIGHPAFRPMEQRRRESLLGRILREPQIAGFARQRRDDAAPAFTEGVFDRLLRVRTFIGHGSA